MTYVDGFVIPVPKNKVNAYKKMATMGKKIWKKYGCLDYKECVGDDLNQSPMSIGFPKGIRAKKGETVFFSFIVYRNKAHRDAVNKKVMSDPSMSPEAMKDMEMPFDPKRMLYGGFKTIVE